ncbi:unnamed protein product, partial [Adineta steineri]
MKLDIDFTVLFRPPDIPSTKVGPHWSHKYHYLQELYSDTKRKNNDPLYLLDRISSELTFTEEKHLVIVLQKLVGDFMLPLYDTQSDNELLLLGTEEDAEHIYRDL